MAEDSTTRVQQLEEGIKRTINQYADESNLNISELCGVLEKVKYDYLLSFQRWHDKKREHGE